MKETRYLKDPFHQGIGNVGSMNTHQLDDQTYLVNSLRNSNFQREAINKQHSQIRTKRITKENLSLPIPSLLSKGLPPYNRPGIALPIEKCIMSTSWPRQLLLVHLPGISGHPPICQIDQII